MEDGNLKTTGGVWWFALGCVALAVYVVAAGVLSAAGGFVLAMAVEKLAVQAVAMWWQALTPVAACAAAWWACLRFARAAGRPQTGWQGRLAVLGVAVAVVAGVYLFNTGLSAGLRAWFWRWAPPAKEFPVGAGGGLAAGQRVNVKVGIGAPSAASATLHAASAWQLTAACFRGEEDERDGGEEDEESLDPWFEDLKAKMAECRTEVDVCVFYGPPMSRNERPGGMVVGSWDWGGRLLEAGRFDGCRGLSAGIDGETGELRWWAPNWMGHVPEDVPAFFPVGGEVSGTEEE